MTSHLIDQPVHPLKKISIRLGLMVIGTCLFAVAYSQSPLYTSNQNQYFLHGLARAGFGALANDWLANTPDPTPVFSALVEGTYRITHWDSIFYLYYALLMGIYLVSMFGITDYLFNLHSSRIKTLLYVAIFITLHSAGLRFAISQLLGSNWSYILEDGVADQRMLGPVFQPSSFGVLIVLSIFLFLKDRLYLAVLAAVLSAVFHPTYLLSAAVLTAVYMLLIFIQDHQVKRPLLVGGFALLTAAPIVIYVLRNFGSRSAELSDKAQRILVDFRIPNHAIVSQWLDLTVLVKVILVIIALCLVRHKRILFILLATSGCAILLTLIQVVTQSNGLALIFPWRLSIFILPISVAVIVGSLLTRLLDRSAIPRTAWNRGVQVASILLILLSVVVGSIRFKIDLERKASEPERGVERFIALHRLPGEIYLIPTKLQDFRLISGAPAYVDFKAIPYKDVDVLEWYRRVRLADRFYKKLDCSLLGQLISEDHITQAVIETGVPELNCPHSTEIYRDPSYILYRVSEQ